MAKKSRAVRKKETMAKTTSNVKTTAGMKAQADAATKQKEGEDMIFKKRLARHHDELRWLYMELYGNDDMFAELCAQMKQYYDARNDKLKKLDAEREAEGEWYRKRYMLGMMMYIDNFAGNIKGVQ